jgi:hypothetical protein
VSDIFSLRGGCDDWNVEGCMFEGGGATQFLQFWADDMTLKCPIMMAVEKQMKQDYGKRMCALEHAAFALECCRLKLSHNLRKLSKLLTSRSARELASHVQPPVSHPHICKSGAAMDSER